MKCSCPKCSTAINLDIQEIPTEGFFSKCPDCGVGYLLKQESFARRALRKVDTITCAECGGELGSENYCQSCHALYPDYYATEAISAAKNKLGKLFTKFKGGKRSSETSAPTHYVPANASAASKAKGQPLQLAVIGLVLLALLGSGGYFYYQHKMETEYCEKFVRVVSFIKSANDLNNKIISNVSTDWRARQTPSAPTLSPKDKGSLSRAKADVDLVMKELTKTPEKYAANQASLGSYYDTYIKMHSLTSAPTGSLDSFTEATKKLDDEFHKTGSALKSGLSGKLAEAFTEGKEKYRELSDM